MFDCITVVSPTLVGQKRDYERAVAKETALMYTPTDFDPPRHSHFTMEELLGIVPKYLVNAPSVMQLYKLMIDGASHEDIMRDISVTRDDNLFWTGFLLFATKFNKVLDGMGEDRRKMSAGRMSAFACDPFPFVEAEQYGLEGRIPHYETEALRDRLLEEPWLRGV